MAVNLAELTNGTTVVRKVDGLNTYTWQGTAVFDVLVRMVNENLKIQYDEGRIKATDYAEAYIAGLQTCVTESMNYIMQKDILTRQAENLQKDIEVKQANIGVLTKQAENLTKDIAVKDANIALLNRQKDGFDDNNHQKLFEAQMNAWALMFSSGLLTTQPSIISNDSASSLYAVLKPQ